MIRLSLFGALLVLLLSSGAHAQEGKPVGVNPPCSAFGTTVGTCLQGSALATTLASYCLLSGGTNCKMTGPISVANASGNGIIFLDNGGANGALLFEGSGGALNLNLSAAANSFQFATSAPTNIWDYNVTNANAFTFDTGSVFGPNLPADTAATDRSLCWKTSNGQLLTGTGTLGICLGTSGAQFKTAMMPMAAGIDEIAKLSLINYRYRDGFGDNGERMQYGLTAQDVEQVMPDLVRHDEKGDAINFDIGALLPIALHAIQQLKADNDKMRSCQQKWKCRILGID